MYFIRNNGRLIFNSMNKPRTGIVFIYANWSESRVYLKYLIGLLEEFSKIDLYVYDIDEENTKSFMTEFNVMSHGVGETFWLFEGEIISKILNYQQQGKKVTEYTKSLNYNLA